MKKAYIIIETDERRCVRRRYMLMKNRKSLFIIIAAITIVAAGITAFATGSLKMKYEPGTEDTVTNMPAEADWVDGAQNTVASNVPEREGYEFVGWKLDYGTEPDDEMVTYHVYHEKFYMDSILQSETKTVKKGTVVTESVLPQYCQYPYGLLCVYVIKDESTILESYFDTDTISYKIEEDGTCLRFEYWESNIG